MTKVVFSRTLKDASWQNSRVVPALDPHQIEATKKEPGKDIIVFGSGSIVSQLTQHGLIDEYEFVVCPVFIGSGRTLLSDASKSARLALVNSKQYQSGDVMLRYTRAA
jgi:dihydrofolate reductase